jgi:glycosyltransferase involved in cell wall biosynthesis
MPIHIPESITKCLDAGISKEDLCKLTSAAYKLLSIGKPEISVVLPAFNEEHSILSTLYSIAKNKTSRSVEIIVCNNNSTDNTELLVSSCGVKFINVSMQGISFARNSGLRVAAGKYILNADADTIYPENWIEEMVKPLIKDRSISLTYGRFCFIPTGSTGRIIYFLYEQVAELSRWYHKRLKDESVNVYGFNSAFRKEQGIMVEGFNHPEGAGEDGYLAYKLRNGGFGKLFYVETVTARVWTSDRRIQIDGGLYKAIILRSKRFFKPSGV